MYIRAKLSHCYTAVMNTGSLGHAGDEGPHLSMTEEGEKDASGKGKDCARALCISGQLKSL